MNSSEVIKTKEEKYTFYLVLNAEHLRDLKKGMSESSLNYF